MLKKKIDSRIRTLIENGVNSRHRSLFVIVGDHGRDQIVNLHYILSKATVSTRPSVLWAYKKDLGFTTHKQKRLRKIKRDIARGMRAIDESNPFELFLSATSIRYIYYKETDQILGQTFGMCILQDFNAITPNILARCIETVSGGGIIIILIQTLSSLKQLYSMAMDVHSRYETATKRTVKARFNERFLLSLTHCQTCAVVDDELNILPISSHIRAITKASNNINVEGDGKFKSQHEEELKKLKTTMSDTQPIGSLINTCVTLDQAKALLTFIESISEKTFRSTVALTASRGRGKSAALGLAIAGAIAYGYSNIFITAPSPENVMTLFQFIINGLNAINYKEHNDYTTVQSTNIEHHHALVRINIFHTHRQTIQYIRPDEVAKLSTAELLVIDEAAAIPLLLVKALMGPYLIFMASTVNGYEGTGRSLSLKLLKSLRQSTLQEKDNNNNTNNMNISGRSLREVTLEEPIRYAPNDPIESWLTSLLCLDCSSTLPRLAGGVPHPSQCNLYYVNRDTLFSGHSASELFLARIMALFVTSHYKNTPNDLQLLSDAPSHHLFVLLGPQSQTSSASSSSELPDVLCVIQLCMEGEISSSQVKQSLGRGERPSGDLIPWLIAQQFQNNDFASLSGARIVRIATHPELMRMGYASRAMQILMDYYQGKIISLDENTTATTMSTDDNDDEQAINTKTSDSSATLLTESIVPRGSLPPLLQSLSDRTAEHLHYIGTSYGITTELFHFWRKLQFIPLYIRLTANELTGEHTTVMLRELNNNNNNNNNNNIINNNKINKNDVESGWLQSFSIDFCHRFVSLLSYQFAVMETSLALSIVTPPNSKKNKATAAAAIQDDEDGVADTNMSVTTTTSNITNTNSTKKNPLDWSTHRTGAIDFIELTSYFSSYDIRRLDSYASNLVDYHLILDLIPILARLFFTHRLPVSLSFTQQAILLALGLQHKNVETVETELELVGTSTVRGGQVLALFNRAVRKLSSWIKALEHQSVAASLHAPAPSSSSTTAAVTEPVNTTLQADLNESASKVKSKLKEKQKVLLSGIPLAEFAIKGDDAAWDSELKEKEKDSDGANVRTSVSIKKTGGGSSNNKKRDSSAKFDKRPRASDIHTTEKTGKKRKILGQGK